MLTLALKIWLAAIDDTLTAEGIISPGLGDTVSPVQSSLLREECSGVDPRVIAFTTQSLRRFENIMPMVCIDTSICYFSLSLLSYIIPTSNSILS